MGAPVLDQRTYNIGDDDAIGGDPDSCTFDGADTPRVDQAKESNFMVRIGVAEDGGNPTGSKNWQLYGNTVDNPATATLIDTGTTTPWASIIAGSITDKANCTDELCTAQPENFSILGQALDVSDETDKIVLGANNNVEFQFCIQFTSNAGDNSTYYFYVRFNDTVFDGTHVAAIVTTVVAEGQDYKKYINETLDMTEEIVRKMSMKRLIFATEGIQESISIQISTMIKQFINETIDLTETIYRKIALKRFISSIVSLTENIKSVRALKRIISETIDLVESVKSARAMKRFLASTVQIDENLNRKKLIIKILLETIGLIESIATAISAILIKIISEILGIDESVSTNISAVLIKIISEVIDLIEVIFRKSTIKKILSETVDIIEGIVYLRTLKRIISATVELIERITPTRTIKRVLSSTLSIIESLARFKTMKRIISEGISIVESIGKTVIGIATIIYQDFRNVFTFDNLRRIFRVDR